MLALALVACDPPRVPFASTPDACRPRTCVSLAFECGDVDDGCGTTLACGICDPSMPCGEAMPHVCGTRCVRDGDCAVGMVCDLGSGHCTSGCRTGTRVALDVRRAPLAIDVTMDGGALPSLAPAGAVFLPTLELRSPLLAPDTTTPSVYLPLYSLPAGATEATPIPAMQLQVVPGTYDVLLQSQGSGFPMARDAIVGHVVVPAEGTSLAIDVHTAMLDLTVTLAGADVPSTSDRATPFIELTGAHGGLASVMLCETVTASTSRCTGDFAIRVLADTYVATYDREGIASTSTPWPVSYGAPLGTIDVTHDVAPSIDIPRVHVSATATLRGAPLADVDLTAPGHYVPTIVLTRGVDQVRLPLYDAASDGMHFTPSTASVAIVAGTFDVSYENWSPAAFGAMPAFGASLEAARTITTDTLLSYDLATVTLDYAVSVNGATATTGGCIVLGDRGVPPSGSAELLPSHYALAFASGSGCPTGWPSSGGFFSNPIAPDLIVTVDRSVTFAVTTVDVTTPITLAGAAPPLLPRPVDPRDFRSPTVDLAPSAGGAPGASDYYTSVYYAADVLAPTRELHLVTGAYDVRYLAAASPPWPVTSGTITHGLDVSADGTLAIDVPARSVSLAVGVVGLGPSPASRAASIVLVRRGEDPTRVSPTVLSLTSASAMLNTTSAIVLPGTYDVRYLADPTADAAPGGIADLGCWTIP